MIEFGRVRTLQNKFLLKAQRGGLGAVQALTRYLNPEKDWKALAKHVFHFFTKISLNITGMSRIYLSCSKSSCIPEQKGNRTVALLRNATRT